MGEVQMRKILYLAMFIMAVAAVYTGSIARADNEAFVASFGADGKQVGEPGVYKF
jgi:hypothetical protein